MRGLRKRCVYCFKPATTRDHVPPRCLLEAPYPPNLPTVPSCAKCNNTASLDEQYFLAVLAQIATVPHLSAKIDEGGALDRAFSQSSLFDDRIMACLHPNEGRVYIKPEFDRVHAVIRKIAAGLFYRRYGSIPKLSEIAPVSAYPYNIEDQRPVDILLATHSERFQPKRWRHVQRDIFSYIVVRDPRRSGRLLCIMDFSHTLWGVASLRRPPPRKKRTKLVVAHTPDLFDKE